MKLLSLAACLLLCAISQAQIWSAVVTGEDNQLIEGAVVQVTPQGNTARSGPAGRFSIACNAGDSIVISHTGYISIRFLVGSKPLPGFIVMQRRVQELAEVQVSTGYQSLPKERATGSFEKINTQQLNEQVSTSVLSRLEGLANGLYFDKKNNPQNPRITIRGLSTIKGPAAPLIILDNFPYNGSLDNINPNDVESITLLKDAAAASIWGTQAGNGVIVITTKKAKGDEPLRIDFNSSVTIIEQPNLFRYDNINPADYAGVERFLYEKGYYNSQISSSARPPLSPVVELLVKRSNGSLSAAEADAAIAALAAHDLRNDFDKYFYRKAVNRQYALSLRAGKAGSSWMMSAGLDDNTGNLSETYRRITARIAHNLQLGPRWTLRSTATFVQARSRNGKPAYGSITTANGNLPAYTRLTDDAGQAIAVMRQYRQPYLDTAGGGLLLDWNYYPLTDYTHVQNNNNLYSLVGVIGLSYKPVHWFWADINYQYEQQAGRNKTVYDADSYVARDAVNNFSQVNRSTGVVSYVVPKGGILTTDNSLLQAHNLRNQLNFAQVWKRNAINAIAGFELREVRNTGEANRVYGYNDGLLTYAPVDFTNAYKRYVTGATAFIQNDLSFSATNNRFVSLYTNAAYTYDNRLTASVSGRRDASNLFGVRTNDRWTPLWSAGLAWEISRELFYRLRAVTYLKARATYGVSGNADPSRSGFTVLAYSINSPNTGAPTARISQFVNADLRWEKIAMLNLGLDVKVWDNRLEGSIEFYHKKGSDLLGNAPADYTNVPASTITKNVAEMTGSGWDVALRWSNMRRKLLWLTDVNLNTNRDKVTAYLLPNRTASNYLSGGLTISALEQRPVYAVYAYKWAGLDPETGEPRGFLGGVPSKNYTGLLGSTYPVDSLVYIGRALPAFFGSMGNSLSYKGLTFTLRISWKMGYYFLRNSIHYNNLFASRQGHGDYARRWQQPGDEAFTQVPAMLYPAVSRRDQLYNNSEILAERGDHIRVQYITMDYDLKTIWKKAPFKALNVYLSQNNVGILWRANDYGIDPDYKDNAILPGPATSFGIRASL